MPNNKELISEIRNRIQFLVTVEIFFLSFLLLFSEFIGSNELISSGNALFFGVGIAFCILSYLWVGMIEELKRSQLIWVRGFVSLNLFFFPLLFVIIALVSHQTLPGYWKWLFEISFLGVLVLPILTFLTILGIQYWQGFRWFLEWLNSRKK